MNKCACCGRFRKWEDLRGFYEPDSEYSSEDTWFECVKCMSASDLEDFNKSNEYAGVFSALKEDPK